VVCPRKLSPSRFRRRSLSFLRPPSHICVRPRPSVLSVCPRGMPFVHQSRNIPTSPPALQSFSYDGPRPWAGPARAPAPRFHIELRTVPLPWYSWAEIVQAGFSQIWNFEKRRELAHAPVPVAYEVRTPFFSASRCADLSATPRRSRRRQISARHSDSPDVKPGMACFFSRTTPDNPFFFFFARQQMAAVEPGPVARPPDD